MLTNPFNTGSSELDPVKDLLGGDYTVVVGTLRGSTRRAPYKSIGRDASLE